MPDLDFAVIAADVLPFAASPTLGFTLHIRNADAAEQVHSIALRTQIRIETTRRHYGAESESRLLEIFGEPRRWGVTLRSMLWATTTSVVPRFTGDATAELPIPCTYDFEVAATKYFHALEEGEVPLLFLFSGTAFYTRADGPLQIAQIPWEKEARFRLPIRLWKEMMDLYFPNGAWIRLRRDVFDRLYAYRAQRALPTWEATLEQLLEGDDRARLSCSSGEGVGG